MLASKSVRCQFCKQIHVLSKKKKSQRWFFGKNGDEWTKIWKSSKLCPWNLSEIGGFSLPTHEWKICNQPSNWIMNPEVSRGENSWKFQKYIWGCHHHLPSGKRSHSNGISPCLRRNTDTSSKGPFSIAMLVYWRVALLTNRATIRDSFDNL